MILKEISTLNDLRFWLHSRGFDRYAFDFDIDGTVKIYVPRNELAGLIETFATESGFAPAVKQKIEIHGLGLRERFKLFWKGSL